MPLVRYLVAIAFGLLSALSLLTPIGLVIVACTGGYRDLNRSDGFGALVTQAFTLGGALIASAAWPRRRSRGNTGK